MHSMASVILAQCSNFFTVYIVMSSTWSDVIFAIADICDSYIETSGTCVGWTLQIEDLQ